VDPAVRISLFQEFSPGEGFSGVTQVKGFHDDTRAFLFQGKTMGLQKQKVVLLTTCMMQSFPKFGIFSPKHVPSGICVSGYIPANREHSQNALAGLQYEHSSS